MNAAFASSTRLKVLGGTRAEERHHRFFVLGLGAARDAFGNCAFRTVDKTVRETRLEVRDHRPHSDAWLNAPDDLEFCEVLVLDRSQERKLNPGPSGEDVPTSRCRITWF